MGDRPLFGNQQPGVAPFQTEHFSDVVSAQIDPVDHPCELLDEPHAHASSALARGSNMRAVGQTAEPIGTPGAYNPVVPTTPVRFRLPPRCKLCGGIGTVRAETTIARGIVRLTWCCRACGREWPITRGEQQLMEPRTDANAERSRTPRRGRGRGAGP